MRLVLAPLLVFVMVCGVSSAQVKNADGSISFPTPEGPVDMAPPSDAFLMPMRIATFIPKDDFAFDLNCRDLYGLMSEELTGLPTQQAAMQKVAYLTFNSALNQYKVKPNAKDIELGTITSWGESVPEDDDVFFDAIQVEQEACFPRLKAAITEFEANDRRGKDEASQ